MQKVYLLLRNNKQTGPMTLDELLSKGLKKTDLIWMEGRSAAWSFPSEIEHLKEYLPNAENTQKNTGITQPAVQQHQQETVEKKPEPKTETAFLSKSKLVHVILPQRPAPRPSATSEVATSAETNQERKNVESKIRVQAGTNEHKSRLASPIQATQKVLFPEEKTPEAPVAQEPANAAVQPETTITADTVVAPEQVSIEEKAEALRKKIAAFNAEKNGNSLKSSAVTPPPDTDGGTQINIEEKAEAIRRKIAAYNEAKKNGTASETAAAPGSPAQKIADVQEDRAEELRKKIAAYNAENRAKQALTASAPIPGEAPPLETKFARSLNDIEEEYASWTYSSKTRKTKFSKKKIATAALAVLLVTGLFGVGRYLFSGPSKDITTTEANIDSATISKGSDGQQTIKTEAAPNSVTPVIPPAVTRATPRTENPQRNVPAKTESRNQKAEKAAELKKAELAKNKAAEKNAALAKNQTNTVAKAGKKKPEELPEKTLVRSSSQPANTKVAVPGNEPVVIQHSPAPNPAPVAKKPAGEVSEIPKKKTFSDKVDDFFTKLQKKEEPKPVVEDPKSTQPQGQQRTARRREDEVAAATKPAATPAPAPAEPVDITDQVEITYNDPPESFLMGIHGLRITLSNKSDHVVKNAAVEVRYYNEEKEVLEKKIVNFSNVPAKKRVILAAPDHRLADHADAHLLSVVSN